MPHDWGEGGSCENSSQGSQRALKGYRPYSPLCRLHQEGCPRAAGNASPTDPPSWPMGTPSALCTSPTHNLRRRCTTADSLCMSLWVVRVSPCKRLVSMASEHTQKAGCTLQDWEKAHTLGHLAPPQEKQMRGSQHLTWLWRMNRRHIILIIRPLPKREQECGAGVSTEGLRKPQNS